MLKTAFLSGSTFPLYDPKSAAYVLVEKLGIAMNCLKQKPWKQTHMLTDTARFEYLIIETFYHWVTFARTIGMNAQEAFDFYFKKSEVNIFRQRSQY